MLFIQTQLEQHDKKMLQQENKKLFLEYAAMKEVMEIQFVIPVVIKIL